MCGSHFDATCEQTKKWQRRRRVKAWARDHSLWPFGDGAGRICEWRACPHRVICYVINLSS